MNLSNMKNKNIHFANESSLVTLSNGKKISVKELVFEFEEQQRILADKASSAILGEVLPMIAHQWQQPLQIISILVQKLSLFRVLGEEKKDDFIARIAKEIGNQLSYMTKTIDDFRNFHEIEKKKVEIKISQLTKKAEHFLNLMLLFDEIKLITNIISDTKLYIHTNEIEHVFINILKNARDAMVENSTKNREIIISSSCNEKYAFIQIEDNAGGIPNDIINSIFDPNFTTKKGKGTGLGLYMCKKIIEENYLGEIEVKNGEKGAIFTIKLPINLGGEVAI